MLEKEAWTGIARTKGGPCKVLVFHPWKLVGTLMIQKPLVCNLVVVLAAGKLVL